MTPAAHATRQFNRVLVVAGARPNFVKIAPLMEHLVGRRASGIASLLVHTGQHYDEKMSRLFFDELGIPRPDINLEVGSGSHAQQTAEVMKRFEPVCLEHAPDAVAPDGIADDATGAQSQPALGQAVRTGMHQQRPARLAHALSSCHVDEPVRLQLRRAREGVSASRHAGPQCTPCSASQRCSSALTSRRVRRGKVWISNTSPIILNG